MASVPSARTGHVTGVLRLLTATAVLLFLGFSFLPFGKGLSEDDLLKLLTDDVVRIQADVTKFFLDIERDVLARGRRFADRGECEIRFADEVFFRLEQGVIKEYCGETSYWKEHAGPPESWAFHEHRGGLYYLSRLSDDLYYCRYLWQINDPEHPLFSFSVPRLSVSLDLNQDSHFQAEAVQKDKETLSMIFPLNVHPVQELSIHLSLNPASVANSRNPRGNRLGMWLALAVMAVFFILRWMYPNAVLYDWQGVLEEWSLLLVLAGLLSSYWQISLIFTLALLSGLFRTLLFFGRNGLLYAKFWAIPASFLFIFSFRFFHSLVKAASFPSDRFSMQPGFLVLMLCGAVMTAIPVYLVQFDLLLKKTRNRVIYLILLSPVVFLQSGLKPFWLSAAALLLMAVNLISEKRVRVIFINIPLIAIILQSIILIAGEREKRDYIEDNLSAIFLNQDNYAKSIAREMVHEINSSLTDLRILFYPDENQIDLAFLWEQSLAAKENLPSGIFVCNSKGQVIRHVAHLIPYIDLELPQESLFPFWAISQTSASLYGRPISVAFAAILVYDGGQLLGTIYIQVLNISSLLHQDISERNIFALNPKISGNEIGFFRVDDQGRLADNPFHVSFPEEALANARRPEWLNLVTENGLITCYRFPYGDSETIYLFFARSTFITISAEWIKLMLVYGIFGLFLMGLSPLKQLILRYYRTFSFKVLLFLLLLTLGSALVLALNSFNFYRTASGRNREVFWYEQGRVAQNMTINFLETSGGIDTESLILLGQLLNGEISVYRNGRLIDSSNYRRIVTGEIPVLMNSRIKQQLIGGAEGVILDRSRDDNHIYYRVNNLVYMLELGGNWRLRLFERDNYTDFMINILFLIFLIGSWIVFFVRNHIVSPITVLNTAMAEVEKGNLMQLPQTPRESEIKQLFTGFNAMVSGVAEQQRSVSDLSRMRTLVKMGRRVAHEVKNPLTPIKLSAEQIQRALQDRQPGHEEIIRKALQFIIEETDHLKRVSYGFLDLSKMDTLEREEFDIVELLGQEIFAFRQMAPRIRFKLESQLERLVVNLDRLKVKQVFKNLIQNAVDAVGDMAGEIRIGVEIPNAESGVLRLWVGDDGVGMEEELKKQLFEENFSLKDNGFGIGLFIVKRIVDLHGGRIWVDSAPGKGTVIRMEFPKE